MPEDRLYRIEELDIELMRDRMENTPFEYYIDSARGWLNQIATLDERIADVRKAFHNTNLGDGTGLTEATGLDDYASDEELSQRRKHDLTISWQQLSPQDLQKNYSAPTFMNSKGFAYYLPAFLLAELNDRHPYGFIEHLIHSSVKKWKAHLSDNQRTTLANLIAIVRLHPEHTDEQADFENLISELTA